MKRTRKYTTLLVSAATILAGFGMAACTHSGTPSKPFTPPPAPAFTAQDTDPVETRFFDCGDGDGNAPCVTWDENEWRLVVDYTPYSYVRLYQCTAEDGGKKLPCVWKDFDNQGKWIVFTAPRAE